MLKLCDLRDARQSVWLVAPKVTIGRAATCDLTLVSDAVAKVHAEVLVEGDRLTLRTLSDYAEVEVNGQPVADSCPLKLNDRITIGDCKLAVVDPKVTRVRPGAGNSAQATWALRANHPAIAGRVFPVKQSSVVGRSDECDITFSLSHLSRRHARLEVRDGLLFVLDLGSANGTFLNNRRINETRVRRGDELRFDTLSFSVVGPADDLDKTSVRPAVNVGPLPDDADGERGGRATAHAASAARPGPDITGERQRYQGSSAATAASGGSWLWLGLVVVVGLGAAAAFWARQQGLL